MSFRQRLSSMFDDEAPRTRAVQIFNATLAALIVINVAAAILESVEPIHLRYAGVFDAIEHVATAVFLMEYGLRARTAVDLHGARFRDPVFGRLRLLRLLRMLKLTRLQPPMGGPSRRSAIHCRPVVHPLHDADN